MPLSFIRTRLPQTQFFGSGVLLLLIVIHVDEKYDFRYSQLIKVFGRLLRDGRITRAQLDGLAQDKLVFVDRLVPL